MVGEGVMNRMMVWSFVLLMGGCSLFGVEGTAEPEYMVVLEEESFQIRDYRKFVIAETVVEEEDFDDMTSIGFRRLADYIFGNNKKREKIPMTAPVLLDRNSSKQAWRMVFVLPAKYNSEKAPPPVDSNVVVKTVGEKRFAVVRFSGLLSEKKFDKNTEKLKDWIKGKGYRPLSKPLLAGYNPPWTLPFLRRNEVLIEVDGQ